MFPAGPRRGRRQQAKSLEFPAAMGLSRLWNSRASAWKRGVAGAIYSWFTEGIDPLDLQEARALLEVLA